MDYEKNIEELNLIIGKLSNDNLKLDESVALYEKATALSKECNEYLEKQSGKFYKIKQNTNKFDEIEID